MKMHQNRRKYGITQKKVMLFLMGDNFDKNILNE